MKITLRKCQLKKGRQRLFLDIYPPAFNPVTGKKTGYENLKLFLYDHPKDQLERVHNKETLQLAENIRARRQLDIQSQLHGFTPNYRRLQSFKDYFKKMAARARGMSRHNWTAVCGTLINLYLPMCVLSILIFPFVKTLRHF